MSGGATLTALLSAGSALVCLRNDRHLLPSQPLRRPTWRQCAVALFLLALAAGLKIDHVLLVHLRALSIESGWYAWRRPLQALTLAHFVLCGFFLWRWLQHQTGVRHGRGPGIALQTTILLAWGLFLMRAVSLHAFDALFLKRMAGVTLGRWLEWSVLLAIFCLAWRSHRKQVIPPLHAWKPHDV